MPLARAHRKAAAGIWLPAATIRESMHHEQLLERIYCVDWGMNVRNWKLGLERVLPANGDDY